MRGACGIFGTIFTGSLVEDTSCDGFFEAATFDEFWMRGVSKEVGNGFGGESTAIGSTESTVTTGFEGTERDDIGKALAGEKSVPKC